MAVDPDGHAVVAVREEVFDGSELRTFAHRIVACLDPMCSRANLGPVVRAPRATASRDELAVVVGRTGLPIVVFRSDTGLVWLQCGDPLCAAGNRSSGFGPGGHLLAVSASRRDAIDVGLFSAASRRVVVVSCTRVPECASPVVTPLAEVLPSHTVHLWLGASGYPAVVHWGRRQNIFAKDCLDTSCRNVREFPPFCIPALVMINPPQVPGTINAGSCAPPV